MRDQPRFAHGLVLGKFYPPHSGHDLLIRAAVRSCESVTVEVIGSSVESIPVEVRADWIAQEHPTVRVVSTTDDTPIDYDSPEIWDLQMRTIRGLLDAPVDAVFASEGYGAELARRLDAQWVEVDAGRVAEPVSGTAVRADLTRWWSHLSATVRVGLINRVVLLGAESTGTTTLTEALAQHYSTVWVPEYGRTYSALRPGGPTAPWRSDEFDLIVERQIRDECAAARRARSPLLLCDTDVLATSLWHERYVGTISPTVVTAAAAHRPLLYILTGDEIDFVDDGMRDGEHIRHDMQDRFRATLAAQPVPWLEVRGSVSERLELAVEAIDDALAQAITFAPSLEESLRSTAPTTSHG